MEPFKIPDIKEPTLEEHKAASAQWLARIGPCLYENWPQELKDISFPTKQVILSAADQSELCSQFDSDAMTLSDDLLGRINAAICGDVFPRLSSRSAKDAWCDSFKCSSAEEIIYQFTSSERILDDLIEYKYADIPCYLLLREWRDIPLHQEWRCFIKDRAIIGISQYHYRDKFASLLGDGSNEHSRLRDFLTNSIIPVLHIDTVVVDVYLADVPVLIEINPYGLSDPCLLTYAELNAGDCGFRMQS